MPFRTWFFPVLVIVFSNWARAEDPGALRLVPFPKEVRLEKGTFELNQPMTLEVSQVGPMPLAQLLVEELKRAGFPAPKITTIKTSRPFLHWYPETRSTGKGIFFSAQ